MRIHRSIEELRQFYGDLHTIDDSPSFEHFIRLIDDGLKDLGLGYEVLDPAGVKSAAEIQAEIPKLKIACHIRHARNCYEYLQTENDPSGFKTFLDRMERELKDAGVGYEALDPLCLKTAAQIQAEIPRLEKNTRIRHARKHFGFVQNFDGKKFWVGALFKHLQDSKLGFEILDPAGVKNAGDIIAEILKIAGSELTDKQKAYLKAEAVRAAALNITLPSGNTAGGNTGSQTMRRPAPGSSRALHQQALKRVKHRFAARGGRNLRAG